MDDKLTTKDSITVLRNLQDWLYFSAMNGGTSIQREAIDIAIGALKQPEIVRCCDCKYWNSGSCECREIVVYCQDYWVGDMETEAEHFCGYAERRTDE